MTNTKKTLEEGLKAVEKNGEALQYVKNQTPEVCLKAVEQNGYALRYAKKQTPELCLKVVERCGEALQFVEKQTPEVRTTRRSVRMHLVCRLFDGLSFILVESGQIRRSGRAVAGLPLHRRHTRSGGQ